MENKENNHYFFAGLMLAILGIGACWQFQGNKPMVIFGLVLSVVGLISMVVLNYKYKTSDAVHAKSEGGSK